MKYVFRLHAEKTSLLNVHQHYYGTGSAASVANVRWDMLGLILVYGGPFQRVLVGEQGKGLLIGAVLQRGVKEMVVVGGKKVGWRNYPII